MHNKQKLHHVKQVRYPAGTDLKHDLFTVTLVNLSTHIKVIILTTVYIIT